MRDGLLKYIKKGVTVGGMILIVTWRFKTARESAGVTHRHNNSRYLAWMGNLRESSSRMAPFVINSKLIIIIIITTTKAGKKKRRRRWSGGDGWRQTRDRPWINAAFNNNNNKSKLPWWIFSLTRKLEARDHLSSILSLCSQRDGGGKRHVLVWYYFLSSWFTVVIVCTDTRSKLTCTNGSRDNQMRVKKKRTDDRSVRQWGRTYSRIEILHQAGGTRISTFLLCNMGWGGGRFR